MSESQAINASITQPETVAERLEAIRQRLDRTHPGLAIGPPWIADLLCSDLPWLLAQVATQSAERERLSEELLDSIASDDALTAENQRLRDALVYAKGRLELWSGSGAPDFEIGVTHRRIVDALSAGGESRDTGGNLSS